ncbi:TadE family type IV pilus minor pilin [Nocardioides sp. AE5]|uniref:TadE family type IV pilus minor pilin n=1 Tax=Nocardioides sp. AE5 TaxID=2962573 RepID=UPI002881EA24|nr:TadE family type IV pilus minor pilin [Nocardioides sp. AE5]MDT0200557.1 TadE family type IV pilus minor pilin [Nocardioides sp. AE5]
MNHHEQERGAVTAETALAIPLLVAVTLAMIWMVAFGVNQMKTTDAAREAARAIARGESPEEATALAHQVMPGARVEISRTGDQVVVVVTARIEAPLVPFDLAGTTEGTATALLETVPGEDADVPP